MKTNQKYAALSLLTAAAVLAMSFGSLGFAQTVTPLSCSAALSSVGVNQSNTMTATGGNGVYYWSGPSLSVTNSAGSQFAVSYPNPGVYTLTVTSAGQTATCNTTVVAAVSGGLVCSPATQNVTLGQTAGVTASGGNGTYTWSSPDVTINNPNGSGFSVSYASTGVKILTVSSNGASATCAINVLASTGTVTPVTPSLPATGGGYGK